MVVTRVRFSFIVNLLEERSKQQDWAALRKRRASTSTSHGTRRPGALGVVLCQLLRSSNARSRFGAPEKERKQVVC